MSEHNHLSHHSSAASLESSILQFRNEGNTSYKRVISTARWNEIRPFLSRFPLAATDFWGYEVRLQDSQAPVDFLVCISRHHATYLSGSLCEGSLLPFKWEKLTHFVQLWKNADHLFHRTVKNIWLEMDAEEMQKEYPVHNLFYAPNPQLSHEESTKVAKEFWNVFDIDLSPTIWDQFKICQNSLPTGSMISQVGVMLARDKESLRFFAQGMSKEVLFSYLDKIGWQGDTSVLQKLMDQLQSFVETWGLNIELNKGGFRDGIGIECYLPTDDFQKLEGSMAVFQEAGLMTSEIQSLLQHYALQCNRQPVEKYIEFVHHFKISYRSDAVMGGKVYLGIRKNTQFFINTLRLLTDM